MFERIFQWALKQGPRLLFGAAVVILLLAVGETINALAMEPTSRSRIYAGRLWDGLTVAWPTALPPLVRGLSSATLPFFCALVIQRIDLWLQKGGAVVATSPAPAPSWLARHGARLLFALSLVYFLATALVLVDLAQQAATVGRMTFYLGAWLGPLWPGSLLLFASLALDRLDRWLATVRPYPG
jgi:hypothetical protein